MNRIESISKRLMWFVALLLTGFVAGCGGGGGGQDSILGTGEIGFSPLASSTTPVNQAVNVTVNSKLSATFNVAMDPSTITTASFTLAGPGSTPVPGTVSYAGTIATFTPANVLAGNTAFTATITTGAKNMAGNSLVNNYVWTFTTGPNPDSTPPTVSSTSAPNGTIGLPINRSDSAIFSEPMDPLTINATTYTVKQGVTPVAGTVSYVGTTAVFKPSANLAANTTYTSTITTGSKDLAGNALAANYVWSWTTAVTADTTPPTVTSTSAPNGATGLPTNRSDSAIFSEAMDPLTINNVTYTVKQGTNPVAGTVTYVGTTATFKPVAGLAANTTYTSTITTAAKDLAGNALAADYVWSWTTAVTADTTPPTVTSTSAPNGATGLPTNRSDSAIFSEAMDPLTINNVTYTVKQGTNPVAGTVTYVGTTATFKPVADLAANTTYTSTITSAAKDLAGNALAADYVWSWTTAAAADTTPPTVIAVIPANGATNVANNTTVTANFSEPMDQLTISTASFKLTGPGTTPVTGTVTYAGTTATFAPAADLTANTTYTATVSGGTSGAKDTAGNSMVSDYVWSFTTAAAPVVHIGPAGITLGAAGTYGVLAGTSITLAGSARVNGDVGISPGITCNGCDSTTVSGTINKGTTAAAAKLALDTAYGDAMGRTLNLCTLSSSNLAAAQGTCGGVIPGPTYRPGLYKSGTSITIPAGGTITLDAQNDPTAVFIFQSSSTIDTIGGNTHIVLTNMADAKNVYWVAGSSATIGGTTSDFKGTVMVLQSITVNTGTQMLGRALARNSDLTVQTGAVITVP